MSIPSEYSFPRYLLAKKSIDDRALNRVVWDELLGQVRKTPREETLPVVEIGAGIGTLLQRFDEWGMVDAAGQMDYTAVDVDGETIGEAGNRLPAWAKQSGFSVEQEVVERGVTSWRLSRGACGLSVRFLQCDLWDFADKTERWKKFSLLIAQAFLDEVDVPTALPKLLDLLQPRGLFYFPIAFDGETTFQPTIDAELDAGIETLYHRSMDERVRDGRPSGDSKTGRHLFGHFRRLGVELLAVGSSDWVVYPSKGDYPGDENYFLHHILHYIDVTLRGHPELDEQRFAEWLEERRRQINRGELTYIAHQLDFLGRKQR